MQPGDGRPFLLSHTESSSSLPMGSGGGKHSSILSGDVHRGAMSSIMGAGNHREPFTSDSGGGGGRSLHCKEYGSGKLEPSSSGPCVSRAEGAGNSGGGNGKSPFSLEGSGKLGVIVSGLVGHGTLCAGMNGGDTSSLAREFLPSVWPMVFTLILRDIVPVLDNCESESMIP